MSERARAWNSSVRERAGIPELAKEFTRRHGVAVRYGPFVGLHYPPELVESIDAPIAKLLGAYENELHEVLEEASNYRPPVFVDIGCSDGFYAVGFAIASESTVVHAFDIAWSARRECDQLAEANGVGDRVLTHGRATSRAVRRLAGRDVFVLSDCEGAEAEIFDQETVGALSETFVVIEFHEATRPGSRRALCERFSTSHNVEHIHPQQTNPDAFNELDALPPGQRRLALDLLRTDHSGWGVFRPRRGRHAGTSSFASPNAAVLLQPVRGAAHVQVSVR